VSGELRRSSSARAVVVSLRARRATNLVSAATLQRIAPSGRSLLVGFAIIALALGAYGLARETPMFAIQRIEIRGADPAAAAAVRKALVPLEGESLLALGRAEVARRAQALPYVVSAAYDRAFPHTLRVTIVEEQPLAVLHRGGDLFLVSARARVIRPLAPRALLELPRIWAGRATDVSLGETLDGDPGAAVQALLPLRRVRFPVGITSADAANGQLFLHLRTGLELRLGDSRDLPLKLSIARQIVPTLAAESGSYLDVSVPERPVAGTANHQVGG
jgi:cell division protein FtsQ